MTNYDKISFHRLLIKDTERTKAYREAIFQTVQPGDTVLDIGTGSGILAFFACQAGARHVYAVDKEDIIVVAKELAKKNGFANRITFYQSDIRTLKLPESVNVITSELISKAVLGQRMDELVSACRDRFLKSDGKIIPENVSLLVAPVESKNIYDKLSFPQREFYNIDFSFINQMSMHNVSSKRVDADSILAKPAVVYQLNSYQIKSLLKIDTDISFKVQRKGVLHGFCAWFKAKLANDIYLSNNPPGISSWDNLFFPLVNPLEVNANATINLSLKGSHPPLMDTLWDWKTSIEDVSDFADKSTFREGIWQSTFSGTPLSKTTLQKGSDLHTPSITPSGEVLLSILKRVNGRTNASTVIDEISKKYSSVFEDDERITNFIKELLQSLSYHNYIE